MFWEIFLFEIKYRLKRADTYLYFALFFIIALLSFANGALPASDKTYVNAPIVLTKYFTIFSLFMMVITAAIMGVPLYRDLEYNTHEYYFSYPITKNGYFWGRFFGSFLFVIIIGSSLVWGSLLGPVIGVNLGWIPAGRVGPYHLVNYLQPFLGYLLPNLFLSSSIFFALVAYTRNVKSIYSGGVILYIAYMISLFIFHNVVNKNVVFLLDAFAFNPIGMLERFLSQDQLNSSVVHLEGKMLLNRIIWGTVGLAIIAVTYFRFSFVRFFTGGQGRKRFAGKPLVTQGFLKKIIPVVTGFRNGYNRKVIYTLAKIEWLSIIRDSYFRLILGVGIFFLGFIFWIGFGRPFNVPDLPRTVILMDIYNHEFLLFVFLILLFYTGETVHREKDTRFAIINDSLPPPDWVLYGSKLIALVWLSFLFATVPLVVGISIQLARGFTTFNFPAYIAACYGISLPLFIEMIMLAFTVHVLVNNKFAGHAIGLMIWVLMFVLTATGRFNYYLLLFSYTPDYVISDMDGVGPMTRGLLWFNIYWLFFGGLLLVLSAVFYYRGVYASFGERRRLARHRFHGRKRWIAALLLAGFLATGCYNYYNVSYLNTWLSNSEKEQRAVAYERQLKKYEYMPLPGIIKLKMFSDIFPGERKLVVKAYATIVNKGAVAIRNLLLDGNQLTSYSIKYNGNGIKYTNPLIYQRAKFSIFKSRNDRSLCRLYELPRPLEPGDTAVVEVNSIMQSIGFSNDLSNVGILRNGTAFTGGLPDVGYDQGRELSSDEKRKELGLAKKNRELPRKDDPQGFRRLLFSKIADLVSFEATVSTSADQVAITPGHLLKRWNQNGRNYFHYLIDSPNTYFPFPLFSARYSVLVDSIKLPDAKPLSLELYYQPSHTMNINRFMSAYKDGLRYFSKAYGAYPYKEMRLIEASRFVNIGSFPNSIAYGENQGWNANFTNPNQFDYCYFYTAFHLGRQWWVYQVAPGRTLGSRVISEGLSKYGALMLFEKKYGRDNMKTILQSEVNWYLSRRRFGQRQEYPLIDANVDFVWDAKAGAILYGLKDLAGEDNLNNALREFRDTYAFREKPPYAGSNDLYKIIKKHVPDSLQYYLADSWEKITLYDNKLLEATVTPIGKNNQFKVHVKVFTGKTYYDKDNRPTAATRMNDYVDIGVFGADNKNKEGRAQTNPLYLKKHKLTGGDSVIDIMVTGKPQRVGIDPYNKLIDILPDDNMKDLRTP